MAGPLLLNTILFALHTLVGQRHFGFVVCCKSCDLKAVGHGLGLPGMQDLILSTSISKAASRSIFVLVCEIRACRLRR
jgi:hypothetical protein